MRRKRRTKYLWLPPTGTTGGTIDTDDGWNGVDFGSFGPGLGGTTTMLVRPLILDESSEEQVDRNITGAAQTDYFLKRLVGKWWINRQQLANDSGPATYVGAGIFVAKANDPDSNLSINQPIGINVAAGATVSFLTSNDQANAILTYSPLAADAITSPWIWRRTWILSNAVSTTASPNNAFPRSTSECHSVADGPHMDAKTARRIRDGERLWAVIALKNYPINSAVNVQPLVTAFLDYRALGQLRKHRQMSAF